MKFHCLLVVLVAAGCATSKDPGSGGGDDTTPTPDASMMRKLDAGTVLLPDSGNQQPDSGSQQLPDSSVQQPDANLSGCNPPAGSSCDTSPQCGCPGQNCSVTNFTTGATSCVAPGSTPDFSSCTGNGVGQCGVGSTCVDGVCSPYCQSVSDCPGANRDCFQVAGSTGTAVPGFLVCTQYCNPITPGSASGGYSPCGAGVNCIPDTNGASTCIGPTTAAGTQFADCTSGASGDLSLCAPGYACVNDGFGPACMKFCKPATGTGCTGGNTCYSFDTKQYAGTTEIGYCDI